MADPNDYEDVQGGSTIPEPVTPYASIRRPLPKRTRIFEQKPSGLFDQPIEDLAPESVVAPARLAVGGKATSGMLGTAAEQVQEELGPSAAGTAAALSAGTALLPAAAVPVIGPAIPVVGGALAGIGTYAAAKLGVKKAREATMGKEAADAYREQLKINAQENPGSAIAGGLVGSAPMMISGGGALPMKGAGIVKGIANGMMSFGIMEGAGKAGAQATGEEPFDPMAIVKATARGAFVGSVMGLVPGGKAIESAGMKAAKEILIKAGWRVPTEAAMMQLSGAIFDHYVDGKPYDVKEIFAGTAQNIPAFALMNLATSFLHLPGARARKSAEELSQSKTPDGATANIEAIDDVLKGAGRVRLPTVPGAEGVGVGGDEYPGIDIDDIVARSVSNDPRVKERLSGVPGAEADRGMMGISDAEPSPSAEPPVVSRLPLKGMTRKPVQPPIQAVEPQTAPVARPETETPVSEAPVEPVAKPEAIPGEKIMGPVVNFGGVQYVDPGEGKPATHDNIIAEANRNGAGIPVAKTDNEQFRKFQSVAPDNSTRLVDRQTGAEIHTANGGTLEAPSDGLHSEDLIRQQEKDNGTLRQRRPTETVPRQGGEGGNQPQGGGGVRQGEQGKEVAGAHTPEAGEEARVKEPSNVPVESQRIERPAISDVNAWDYETVMRDTDNYENLQLPDKKRIAVDIMVNFPLGKMPVRANRFLQKLGADRKSPREIQDFARERLLNEERAENGWIPYVEQFGKTQYAIDEGNDDAIALTSGKYKRPSRPELTSPKISAEAPRAGTPKAGEKESEPVAFKKKMFQGRGAKPEDVYGPEAVKEGRAVPLLGKADYFAESEQDAKNYGEVSQHDVELKNPYIIDSDKAWRRLLQDSGATALDSRNEEFSDHSERIAPHTEKAQAYLKSRGHDGVVVSIPRRADMNESGDSIKRIRESFGHSQVVRFGQGESKPSKPTSEAPRAAPEPAAQSAPSRTAENVAKMRDRAKETRAAQEPTRRPLKKMTENAKPAAPDTPSKESADLFPDATGKAPTLDRVRERIAQAEKELANEDISSDDFTKADSRLTRLRALAEKLETARIEEMRKGETRKLLPKRTKPTLTREDVTSSVALDRDAAMRREAEENQKSIEKEPKFQTRQTGPLEMSYLAPDGIRKTRTWKSVKYADLPDDMKAIVDQELKYAVENSMLESRDANERKKAQAEVDKWKNIRLGKKPVTLESGELDGKPFHYIDSESLFDVFEKWGRRTDLEDVKFNTAARLIADIQRQQRENSSAEKERLEVADRERGRVEQEAHRERKSKLVDQVSRVKFSKKEIVVKNNMGGETPLYGLAYRHMFINKRPAGNWGVSHIGSGRHISAFGSQQEARVAAYRMADLIPEGLKVAEGETNAVLPEETMKKLRVIVKDAYGDIGEVPAAIPPEVESEKAKALSGVAENAKKGGLVDTEKTRRPIAKRTPDKEKQESVPAEGALASATLNKKAAWKRVQSLREKLQQPHAPGTMNQERLDLIQAESAHAAAVLSEKKAKDSVSSHKIESGQTRETARGTAMYALPTKLTRGDYDERDIRDQINRQNPPADWKGDDGDRRGRELAAIRGLQQELGAGAHAAQVASVVHSDAFSRSRRFGALAEIARRNGVEAVPVKGDNGQLPFNVGDRVFLPDAKEHSNAAIHEIGHVLDRNGVPEIRAFIAAVNRGSEYFTGTYRAVQEHPFFGPAYRENARKELGLDPNKELSEKEQTLVDDHVGNTVAADIALNNLTGKNTWDAISPKDIGLRGAALQRVMDGETARGTAMYAKGEPTNEAKTPLPESQKESDVQSVRRLSETLSRQEGRPIFLRSVSEGSLPLPPAEVLLLRKLGQMFGRDVVFFADESAKPFRALSAVRSSPGEYKNLMSWTKQNYGDQYNPELSEHENAARVLAGIDKRPENLRGVAGVAFQRFRTAMGKGGGEEAVMGKPEASEDTPRQREMDKAISEAGKPAGVATSEMDRAYLHPEGNVDSSSLLRYNKTKAEIAAAQEAFGKAQDSFARRPLKGSDNQKLYAKRETARQQLEEKKSELQNSLPVHFWNKTEADWKTVNSAPQREPDYVSGGDSKYWYAEDGVFRESNHWGFVGDSNWLLDGEGRDTQRENLRDGVPRSGVTIRKEAVAFSPWDEFKPLGTKERMRQSDHDTQGAAPAIPDKAPTVDGTTWRDVRREPGKEFSIKDEPAYKSEQEFLDDYKENGAHDAEETPEEFLRRRFCGGLV